MRSALSLSLCGPKSKPDATHGVSRFAFSSEEREKLTSNNTCACEKMILPFYIGEAKTSERPIEEQSFKLCIVRALLEMPSSNCSRAFPPRSNSIAGF